MEPRQKPSEAELIEFFHRLKLKEKLAENFKRDEDVLVLTTVQPSDGVVGDFKGDKDIEASVFAVLVMAERGLSDAWAQIENCQKELIKLENESDWENHYENAWEEWQMKLEHMSKINGKLILSYQRVRRANNCLNLCKMMTRKYKKLRTFAS